MSRLAASRRRRLLLGPLCRVLLLSFLPPLLRPVVSNCLIKFGPISGVRRSRLVPLVGRGLEFLDGTLARETTDDMSSSAVMNCLKLRELTVPPGSVAALWRCPRPISNFNVGTECSPYCCSWMSGLRPFS